MWAYALTIFTGAFLLFQVQPVIGKYILPWFGGSPGVWTTCLLFFQTVLLGGYAYAHLTSKHLRPKTQAWLHIGLLAVSLALLPIIPKDSWKPSGFGHPTWQILALLVVNLGLPYLVLSATGPLIQEWCRRTHPAASPYRLYALSNTGSLLALASYPFFFEWMFPRKEQATMWAWGLGAFAVVCAFCAWRMQRSSGSGANAASAVEGTDVSTGADGDSTAAPAAPSATDRSLWVALPALASVLLLATTNKLCEDLAVVPFLWVLPLGLYLLSFILCFDSPRWYSRPVWTVLALAGVAGIAKLLFVEDDAPLFLQVAIYSVALFSGCMVCHGELYRLKPAPRRLTSFYLAIAAGGALGGLLVAVMAPRVFDSYAELSIGYWLLTVVLAVMCFRTESRGIAIGGLIAGLLVLLVVPLTGVQDFDTWHGFFHGFIGQFRDLGAQFRWPIGILLAALVACFWHPPRHIISPAWTFRSALFLVGFSAAAGGAYFEQSRTAREHAVSASRNFFGMLTVFRFEGEDGSPPYYMLLHGKITHGMQFIDPVQSTWATTYYGTTSGVGRAIESLTPDRPRRLGLVGLGTGTLAAYVRRQDTMRIYEINPQVEALSAQPDSRFTYVPHSPGKITIVEGDARLSMERELADGQPQGYDLLALDAFNSDAIPVHLLTREAIKLYFEHLAPDGILAVHISNRYFDLEPVVANVAKEQGLACVSVEDTGNDEWWVYDTDWVLVARNPKVLQRAVIAKGASPSHGDPSLPVWTDDYTSLFKVLR